MRFLVPVLFVAVAFAGCVGDEPADDVLAKTEPTLGLHAMEYRGAVVGVGAMGTAVTPDQAGAIHRGFYVQNGTASLEVHVEAEGGDLQITASPHGCGQQACRHAFVAAPQGHLELVNPAEGPWVVDVRVGGTSAGEVQYAMTVALEEPVADVVKEHHRGLVTAAHLGVIRISPDQLGDVYTEFWVPDGVVDLHFRFNSTSAAHVVLGQAGDEGRDGDSEEGFDTKDGVVEAHVEAPQAGVWYFIVFHEDDGPGLEEIPFEVDVVKKA